MKNIVIVQSTVPAGRRFALEYAEYHACNKNEAARLILAGEDMNELEHLEEEISLINSTGNLSLDLARLNPQDHDQVFDMFHRVVAAFGLIDTCVYASHFDPPQAKEQMGTWEQLEADRELIESQLLSLVSIANAAMSHFRDVRVGQLVAILPPENLQHTGGSATTIAAMKMYMNTLRNELAPLSRYVITTVHPHTQSDKQEFSMLFKQVQNNASAAEHRTWSSRLTLIPSPFSSNSKSNAVKAPAKKINVAYVTGASSGIGREVAKQIAVRQCRAGNPVTLGLFARRYAELEKAKQEIIEACSGLKGTVSVEIAELDVSDPKRVWEVFLETEKKTGPADLVIANAGVSSYNSVGSKDACEDHEYCLKINLIGALATCHAAIRMFQKIGGGQLVGMSSVMSYFGATGLAAYCASKSGLTGFLNHSRVELRDLNVVVTSIHPGFIDTRLVHFVKWQPFGLSASYGGRAITDQILRKASSAVVPFFPWYFFANLLALLPAFVMQIIWPLGERMVGVEKLHQQ